MFIKGYNNHLDHLIQLAHFQPLLSIILEFKLNHKVQENHMMSDAEISQLSAGYPSLSILTESHPEFAKHRKIYNKDNTAQPKAIIPITTAHEIPVVLKFVVDHKISVTMRSAAMTYGVAV
jgi:hypothetical protein